MTITGMLLVLHILAGAVALLAGITNLIRKKGDHWHRILGKSFYFSMLAVSATALVLSVVKSSYFLFIVGVFTAYLVITGFRYLSLRQPGEGQSAKPIDWIVSTVMLLFGLAFVGFGLYHVLNGNTFAIVFLVFGMIGLLMVRSDFRNYRGKSQIRNVWLIMHLQRMSGAFAAALTAFLVVNLPPDLLPGGLAFIPWVLPTVILTIVIGRWSGQLQIRKGHV